MKVQVKPLSTKASIIASGVLAQRISSSVRTARLRADAGTEGAHRGKEADNPQIQAQKEALKAFAGLTKAQQTKAVADINAVVDNLPEDKREDVMGRVEKDMKSSRGKKLVESISSGLDIPSARRKVSAKAVAFAICAAKVLKQVAKEELKRISSPAHIFVMAATILFIHFAAAPVFQAVLAMISSAGGLTGLLTSCKLFASAAAAQYGIII